MNTTGLTRPKPGRMAACGLAVMGLLVCSNLRAQIALHDGSTNLATTTSSSISLNNFKVTAGASVLVVSLFDRNDNSNHASPSSLTWNGGTPQTLTRVISVNNGASAWADSDIYYLWNPNPGTATLTASDTSGGSVSAMTMQVYTLGGVDTNVAPVTYTTNNSSTISLAVTLSGSTPGGAWAVVNSSYGTGNTNMYVTSSSGALSGPETWNITSQVMGYVANLKAGASTISANGGSGAGSQKMALGVAAFAPLVLIAAPTNLVATGQHNAIALSWADGSGGLATGYYVLRSTTTASGYVPIATNSGNASVTYTDTSVTNYITYYYIVQAVGVAGTSVYSAEANAFAVGLPSPPTGLAAAPANGAVALTWNAQPGATSYNVLRATSNPASQASYTLMGSPAAASFTDTGLVNGTTYYYEVNVVNGFGTSSNSAYVSAVPGFRAGPPLTEIRTASPTVLVAFFHDPTFNGPVWGRTYTLNAVDISNPSLWSLNGTPVTAIDEFVTESRGSDYHIFLHVPPLVNGISYRLVTPYGSTNFVFSDTNVLCESIHVNQNGYSALSQVRYANLGIWLGTGGSQPISGPLPIYTVLNQFTGQQVASGTLQTVTNAQPDTSSGDYLYRIDLSGVPAGGPYRLVVSGYGCSYPFGVGGDFSRRLAYVAFRGLYYQRCGCPLVQPYAWANIRPYPCHTNVYDDEYPNNNITSTVSTSGPKLNVHGGYHDASNPPRNYGALIVPIVLMTTFEVFPQYFTTNQFNIPSKFDAAYNIVPGGNGIPDILNEANWCLMFFTNVQSTPNEPVGAVAEGTGAYNAGPAWGANMDMDNSIYTTITNVGQSCGGAAGAFIHFARLIQPYNSTLSADFQARGVAAYNAAGSAATYQDKLYYNIQYYLLTGDTTASNYIKSFYNNQTYYFTNTYRYEASGFVVNNGQIWLASYFMSYITATNRPTDPTIVAYFKSILQQAADREMGDVNAGGYPCGWPMNYNPYTNANYVSGAFTSQGEFAYPCLMQWALTGTQKYLDTVSQLMDYDQGLNPLGKCYLTGVGFNRVRNPELNESSIYSEAQGLGGPQPGMTIYGPGTTQARWYGSPQTSAPQVPDANSLPRERVYVDDLGNSEWSEFTDYQCETWPAAIYPVLAQGGTWRPTKGEPFLNPAASIQSATNGWVLRFGGIPYQTYLLQSATNVNGPWVTASAQVAADVTGMVRFTDTTPAPATKFYRSQGSAPIY